jgi:hypothetical protein
MNCEITAHFSSYAGSFAHAYLSNYDLSNFDVLAAKKLNPKSLAGGVVDILGGTASFNM